MSDETETTESKAETGGAEDKPTLSNIGRIEWLDLTVNDADRVKNFYSNVIGWKTSEVEMGSYSDYCMNLPDSGDTVAGVCYARGSNANIPPQWLVYVRVASVETSATEVEKRGGKILDGPRRMGGSNFCVLEDPAGAVMALLSD